MSPPPTMDQVSVDTLEEGQIISPSQLHKPPPSRPLQDRISAMDTPITATTSVTADHTNSTNLPFSQPGIPSQANMAMNNSSTTIADYSANTAIGDKPLGDVQQRSPELGRRITSAAPPPPIPAHHRPPPMDQDRDDGYERKIGRGTSWRRDHDSRDEQDYTVRGRGRVPLRNGGGRGYHREGERSFSESRDYFDYRGRDREYDRRPPPVDPRYPPDPYYESSRAYPPAYDHRRDYPPHHPADMPPTRYYDDYRRGYDPRDLPPPASSHSPPGLDPRRPPYDRDDPEYGRPYPPRSRDPRDDYRMDPRGPPSERGPPLPPQDREGRYIDEGRLPPRRIDEPRMPPTERRPPRDPLEYREETERRTSLSERPYPRGTGEPTKPPSPTSKPTDNPTLTPQTARSKENLDPARERESNLRGRAPPPSSVEEKLDSPAATSTSAYGYNRERPPPAPSSAQTPERYRDTEYSRAYPPPPPAGRLRDPDPREPPYDRARDPRDPYYDYPPHPPPSTAEYRGREPYPPSRAPPVDYPGNAPYEDRYPPAPMDLEPPRGREGYTRDLPPRSQDYGPKRKLSGSDYVDPYDQRRYPERPDYPRPPYEYDDRDVKRTRSLDPGRYSDPYDRPRYEDRGPFPPRDDYGRPPPHPAPKRPRPHGRFFLVKTPTAENLAQSRATGLWGVQVKDVEILREAYKAGPVYLLFALDESGRFCGYAIMDSDIGTVQPMPWMKEHCDPVGGVFQVKHISTDDVRTNATTNARNFLTEGKPVRFGQDGQEISEREAATLVEEIDRMSGPENAERRANAVVTRGTGRRGRGGGARGVRGGYDSLRGRGRGRS